MQSDWRTWESRSTTPRTTLATIGPNPAERKVGWSRETRGSQQKDGRHGIESKDKLAHWI
eukprot:15461749-Alexandrium_andersonii.AAC.1